MTAISYTAAMHDVMARVNASRTSFHAGMAILPKERREGMFALYAFCRIVDDIADESPTREESLQGLSVWRQKISNLFQNKQADDTITTALLPAIEKFNLIEKDFQDIIDGMAMDADGPITAPIMAVLDLYCDRVASAVGRASVRIFGDSSPNAMDVSYHLGRALQLTNILRDLAEDAARGRLYLPHELLTKYNMLGLTPADVIAHPNLPILCRELAALAQNHFHQADAAMARCLPAAMRPARIMRAYYGAIFNQLLLENWQNPELRVTLPKWKKLWLILTTLIG